MDIHTRNRSLNRAGAAPERGSSQACTELANYRFSGDREGFRNALRQRGVNTVTFTREDFGCFPENVQKQIAEFQVTRVSVMPEQEGFRIALSLAHPHEATFDYRPMSSSSSSLNVSKLRFSQEVSFTTAISDRTIAMDNIEGISVIATKELPFGLNRTVEAALLEFTLSRDADGTALLTGKGSYHGIPDTFSGKFALADYGSIRERFLSFAEIAAVREARIDIDGR